MNNGVNENQNTLAPMAGVKIAPAQEGPVNASTGNNTSVVNAAPQQNVVNTPVVPQIQTQQPVQTVQQVPTIQPETIVNVPQQVPQAPQLTSQIPDPPKVVKNNSKLVPILLVVVLFLVFFMFYTNSQHSKQIQSLKFNCTPITSKEETKLDVNSTLVKDLYGKVKTNIREDLANPNFDDSMKLYLAYRQIKEHDKYDSNCNLYSGTAMEPFKCEVSTNFVPKAFKEETLTQEIKELYGESTNIPLKNIQLGSSCIVGYQYIKERGEFVEGYCKQSTATSFKATKTLKEATSTRTTIILKEEVKYHENEKMSLPDFLKSGIYIYTFRLDMNYNYVLVSKTFEEKYE